MKSSPSPSYSSKILIVAGYVNAERTTPALAASDLSVPVLTPLVVEFEIELLVPMRKVLLIFLFKLKLRFIFL